MTRRITFLLLLVSLLSFGCLHGRAQTTPQRTGQTQDAPLDHRRIGFGPTIVRHANLAPTDPVDWLALAGAATLDTGITGPDRSAGAARLSTILSGTQYKRLYNDSTTLTAYNPSSTTPTGTWVMVGVWVRRAAESTTVPAPTISLLNAEIARVTLYESTEGVRLDSQNRNYIPLRATEAANFGWVWLSAAGKVTRIVGSGAVTVRFDLQVTNKAAIEFYAPVLHIIQSGVYTDAEMSEWLQHFYPVPSGIGTHYVTLLDYQDFAIPKLGDGASTRMLTVSSTGAVSAQAIPSGGGGSLSDGDYGDVTVGGTGTTLTIDNDVITNAKVNSAAAIAYSKLNLSGSIVNADVHAGAAIAYSKLALTNSLVTGDYTANSITNAKLAQMAQHTFKGNNTGSTADPLDLTATQLTAEINAFVGDSGSGGTRGAVPAPSAGDAAANKFLKADGTWAAVSGASAANPSASIGLSAVNGSAGTFMRSDAAPALDQSIAPTMTGPWTFNRNSTEAGLAAITFDRTPGGNSTRRDPHFLAWSGNAKDGGGTLTTTEWRARVDVYDFAASSNWILSNKYNGGTETNLLIVDGLAGSLYFAGVLAGGSGPTTITDSGGKVLSSALNTIQPDVGGTGLASYTTGDLLQASGSTTLAALPAVATGNVLISGGVGAVSSWGKVGLTTHVSGTLAVGNGGTGAASFTASAPIFGNGTSAFAVGTRSGDTTKVATVDSGFTPPAAEHIATFDTNGNLLDGLFAPGDFACLTCANTFTNSAGQVISLAVAGTTTNSQVLNIIHNNSTGAGAAGIGSYFNFQLETSTTASQDAARFGCSWSDATHATRTGKCAISTVNSSGAMTERFTFAGNGDMYVTGRVGVGTTGPTATLVVGDDLNVSGFSSISSLTIGSASTHAYMSIGVDATHNFSLGWFNTGTPSTSIATFGTYSASNPLYIDGSVVAINANGGGRVGFGTTSPATSALVEMSSTTGAFLPPRMTSTQRDALTGVAGMVIYNSTTSKLQVYTSSWVDLH